MSPADFDYWLSDTSRRCLVMGVLNVTPDSFSDGGQFADASAALSHAQRMIAEGADLLDVGGESTRPGADRVAETEQIRRITPVIAAIRKGSEITISVDTTRAAVAAAALEAGANLVNDISGTTDDPAMLPLVAATGVPLVLMHMRGTPKTMQRLPHYENVVSEVIAFLSERSAEAERAGVARERILIDPGIGFGKSMEHNLQLLKQLRELATFKRPLLLGTSRKSFIGKITGETDPGDRLFGTAASVAWCVANGASIVRVHDVEPMSAVVRMIEVITNA